MKYIFLFYMLLIWNWQPALSQQSEITTDTNYIKFYKDKLIIALWQSERSFDILLERNDTVASSVNYIANSNHVSGISIDYDMIGFAFGYRSVPTGNARTGNTDYLDLGLNINTRSIRFENSFKRYTGFYDKKTPDYVQPFDSSVAYTQFPSMNLRVVKSKIIYSFNKKRFALGASYANAKRQMKSAGSLLFVANFYGLNLYSDSSIIPVPLQKHYEEWAGLNRMNVYAYSAGLGVTRTFVFFKKFYFNLFASLGLEAQYSRFYTYPENNHVKYWKTSFAGDWRTALGYNGKRFFMRVTSIYDLNNYESSDLKFEMKFLMGSFDVGYRFKFRAPKPYLKFQETKLYKKL